MILHYIHFMIFPIHTCVS